MEFPDITWCAPICWLETHAYAPKIPITNIAISRSSREPSSISWIENIETVVSTQGRSEYIDDTVLPAEDPTLFGFQNGKFED